MAVIDQKARKIARQWLREIMDGRCYDGRLAKVMTLEQFRAIEQLIREGNK